MKKSSIVLLLIVFSSISFAQINARLFQYPDVSKDKITFSYAGDIWVAPKSGGTAIRLSSPKGNEILPKFSPDGKYIAFTGNYHGNGDIYIIPVEGGIPMRVTYHTYNDRMLDWLQGGKEILFASSRNSGRQRFSQLYKIDRNSGLAEKFPLPYGEFASVSDDGEWIAYTPRTRLFRTWKRYRGGMAADIWLFNLKTFESKNITGNEANDEMPMFHHSNIYFLSDRGENSRYNIYVYDINSGGTKQLTNFEDFDVHFPSIGPDDIVFEAGGDLYLLNLNTTDISKVEINIVADQIKLVLKLKKVSKYLSNASVSPKGKRVAVEARGEIFSLPAKDGVVYNLTNSGGSAERYPAWSPDGKFIAYWSDASGEYELMMKDVESGTPAEKLTDTGGKYKYHLFWSPNSEMLAFIDNAMNIRIFSVKEEKFTQVDKALYKFHGSLEGFGVSWSSDSRYLAYSRGLTNQQNAIFIFDTKENELHQVTSGFYQDSSPAFDPEGKYLFITTKRAFSPKYSSLENTFIYPNSTKLAAVSLTDEILSPLAPKNDEVEIEGKSEDKPDEKEDKKEKKEDDKEKIKEVKIDFDNFESRLTLLPVKAGNYYNLSAVKGKLIYTHSPNTGEEDGKAKIQYYDLKEREEKTIVEGAGNYEISADGKNMLVLKKRKLYIIKIKSDQKLKDAVATSEMEMMIDPKKEFKQIFTDAWRFERDYFYDPEMHGVDWDEV
jgi:tricorn protease